VPKNTHPFERAVKQALDRYQMLQRGDRAIAAISAGPDSTALLAAVASLAHARGAELFAFHLDHGLRGKESDLDRKHARALARALVGIMEPGCFPARPAARKALDKR